MLVDQLAQRDPLGLRRSSWLPDTLAHGAFLRWPPCQAAGWSCTSSTRKNAPFLFFHMTRDATLSAYPRLDMKNMLTTWLCGIAKNHPNTTRDNFIADFGIKYIPGYTRVSSVDLLHQAPFAE